MNNGNHNGQCHCSGGGIAGDVGHDEGSGDDDQNGEKPTGETKVCHQGAKGLCGSRVVHQRSGRQAAAEDEHHVPADLGLGVLPQHQPAPVRLDYQEGDDAADDEHIGGLHAREHSGVELPGESQHRGHHEQPQGPVFLLGHLGEGLDLLQKVLPGASDGGAPLDADGQEQQVAAQQNHHDGQEADDPLHIHELLPGELLEVVHHHQVHGAA